MGTLPKHSVWESHHGLILVKPSICLGQLIGGNSQCYCWWITLPYACKNESMYAPMWFSKTLFMDYHNNSHAHAHTYTFLMYVCYDILHFFSQAYFLLSVLCRNKYSRWHNGEIISYFILNIILRVYGLSSYRTRAKNGTIDVNIMDRVQSMWRWRWCLCGTVYARSFHGPNPQKYSTFLE